MVKRDASLSVWLEEVRPSANEGKVASYIPALAAADPSHLGVSIVTVGGETYTAGDWNIPFTLQSVSKIITLTLALMKHGEKAVFSKVGKEPSGDPFNSLLKLELTQPTKPLNPMINAGALAITAMLLDRPPEESFSEILKLVRELADNPEISWNEDVYVSERETADRNRAIAYYLREFGILEGDIETILDLYFRHCAIEMNTMDLARIGAVYARRGLSPEGRRLIPERVVQICHGFMVTCGMYDASGEFAVDVGIPAKSGVSGAILSSVPGVMGIGVYGPALDEKGNSVAGVHLLKRISREYQISLF